VRNGGASVVKFVATNVESTLRPRTKSTHRN
jgi:hypothetical protein